MPYNPYRQANYILSAHDIGQLPADTGREVAFVGRSNVGKSSVINTITDQKNLARTSKTPGRTQQINFFSVEGQTRLVDLPGYGFAKVPKTIQQQWSTLLNAYFADRVSLVGLMLIIDIRRDISAEDEIMLDWCNRSGIPVHLLLNKADKLPYGQGKQVSGRVWQHLLGRVESLQLYSATLKSGVEEAREVLNGWLRLPVSGGG